MVLGQIINRGARTPQPTPDLECDMNHISSLYKKIFLYCGSQLDLLYGQQGQMTSDGLN